MSIRTYIAENELRHVVELARNAPPEDRKKLNQIADGLRAKIRRLKADSKKVQAQDHNHQ